MLGEFLAQAEKNKGAVPGKTGSKAKPVLDTTPTISEILGMDKAPAKKLSSEAQLLAKLKADAPETHGFSAQPGKEQSRRAERRSSTAKELDKLSELLLVENDAAAAKTRRRC